MRLRTKGRGMAAASSMTTSSAWPKTCASSGWMYYIVNQSRVAGERERERERMVRTHLDRLPMLTKYINAHNGLIEIRISALGNIVIQMLLVAKRVHPLEYE